MKRILLNKEEKEMLEAVRSARRFPLVRFELRNSRRTGAALHRAEPCGDYRPEDSMEIVKARSAVLESLRKKGLIRISYSLPEHAI